MGNPVGINLQDKNRLKVVAATVFTTQSANPLQSGQIGEYSDGTTLWQQDAAGNLAAPPLNRGVVPSSRVAFATNPTANDTIVIGGKTFIFLAALGAATANVQVKIGASAAATLASLIKAINGVSAPLEWVEATTAFAVKVFADASTATQLRVRWATVRGGTPVAGVATSIALAATITAGASAWTNDNLNTIGKSPSDVYEACGQFAITAAMITALATGIFIELPFAPTVFSFDVLQSTGAKKAAILTDTMTVSGNALVLTSAGATHVVAGDILSFWASA